MTSVTLTVLVGTSLLGCAAGIVGTLAVLRRRALVGDALAHAALPGLCLAFLLFGGRQFGVLMFGALVAGLVGVACITFICRWTRTKEDAAIGIVLSIFFGVGVVLLSIIQHRSSGGAKAGLDSYIFGQAAGMIWQDVWLIALVSVISLTILALLYKEFLIFSFDPDFARSEGWPTLGLDLAMMGILALTTVVGLPAVGVVLMAAMLIIPGAAARFWTQRLGPMLVVAGTIGAVSGAAGTLLSAGIVQQWLGLDPLAFGHNTKSLPTGPLIVLCGTACFLFSLCFAPRRGLLSRLWSEYRLRRRVGRQNLLRTMYELTEPSLPERPVIATDELLARRAWRPWLLRVLMRAASRQGWIERTAEGVRLTDRGLERAAAITRSHRLWELYLIQGANIAPDHVDRDADSIEHLLSDEIVELLEAELARQGGMPAQQFIPESPHELHDAESTGGIERG